MRESREWKVTMDLPVNDEQLVEAILKYLYSGIFPNWLTGRWNKMGPAFKIASYLQVDCLVSTISQKIAQRVFSVWNPSSNLPSFCNRDEIDELLFEMVLKEAKTHQNVSARGFKDIIVRWADKQIDSTVVGLFNKYCDPEKLRWSDISKDDLPLFDVAAIHRLAEAEMSSLRSKQPGHWHADPESWNPSSKAPNPGSAQASTWNTAPAQPAAHSGGWNTAPAQPAAHSTGWGAPAQPAAPGAGWGSAPTPPAANHASAKPAANSVPAKPAANPAPTQPAANPAPAWMTTPQHPANAHGGWNSSSQQRWNS